MNYNFMLCDFQVNVFNQIWNLYNLVSSGWKSVDCSWKNIPPYYDPPGIKPCITHCYASLLQMPPTVPTPSAMAVSTAIKNSSTPKTLFLIATAKDDGIEFWYASFSKHENAFDKNEA